RRSRGRVPLPGRSRRGRGGALRPLVGGGRRSGREWGFRRFGSLETQPMVTVPEPAIDLDIGPLTSLARTSPEPAMWAVRLSAAPRKATSPEPMTVTLMLEARPPPTETSPEPAIATPKGPLLARALTSP